MLPFISLGVDSCRFGAIEGLTVFLQRSISKFDLYRLKFSYIVQKYLARIIVLRYSVLAYFNI